LCLTFEDRTIRRSLSPRVDEPHALAQETENMNRSTKLAVGIALVVALGAYFYLQLPKGDMAGMDHSGMNMPAAAATDATKGYQTAMDNMMKAMMARPTGKADLDFVQDMIPHHQGAIDMANVVLKYGSDDEVKSLAQNVIKTQEREIAAMKDWLANMEQSSLFVAPESAKANEAAMDAMMEAMKQDYSGNADADFIASMLPHHQGAIAMAKVAIQYARDPDILRLAQEIVTAQEGEIAFMEDWLNRKAM
jgi:uncharacterized protein (DUF305 family)